jgi:hypothetical protein
MSKMKVLYISDFCYNSKTVRRATNNVLGLMQNDVDVVCRSITNGEADERIALNFSKDISGATRCIQHVPPNMMIGTRNFIKNVGVIENGDETFYNDCVNRMDLILSYGIHPYPIVTLYESPREKEFYERQFPNVNIPGVDHTFKFYTVMNYSERKDVETLFRKFYEQFDITQQVSLIIKARSSGSEKGLFDYLTKMSESIKKEIGKISYGKEIIMCGNLSDLEIVALHKYGDCFVDTSKDTDEDYNMMEAKSLGKRCVATNNMLSTVREKYEWNLSSTKENGLRLKEILE